MLKGAAHCTASKRNFQVPPPRGWCRFYSSGACMPNRSGWARLSSSGRPARRDDWGDFLVVRDWARGVGSLLPLGVVPLTGTAAIETAVVRNAPLGAAVVAASVPWSPADAARSRVFGFVLF